MARSRSKKKRLLSRLALAVGLIAVVVATLYAVYLDHIVTRQFEGRRWTLPAKVYAAPLELYVGLALPAKELEKELQRLQYRHAEQPEHAGEYRRQGTRIDVMLRPARFADETRPAQALTITTDAQGITGLHD
jgi:penicillin-binding protein 1B